MEGKTSLLPVLRKRLWVIRRRQSSPLIPQNLIIFVLNMGQQHIAKRKTGDTENTSTKNTDIAIESIHSKFTIQPLYFFLSSFSWQHTLALASKCSIYSISFPLPKKILSPDKVIYFMPLDFKTTVFSSFTAWCLLVTLLNVGFPFWLPWL